VTAISPVTGDKIGGHQFIQRRTAKELLKSVRVCKMAGFSRVSVQITGQSASGYGPHVTGYQNPVMQTDCARGLQHVATQQVITYY
jgi:hypothetical protein